jgi:hypothetical protein
MMFQCTKISRLSRIHCLGSLVSMVPFFTITLVNMLSMCYNFFFIWRYSPNLGLGLPPRNSPFHFSLLDLRHSVGLLGRMISSSQGLYLYTNTEKQTQTPDIYALSGIRTHDPGFRSSEDSMCLRLLGKAAP